VPPAAPVYLATPNGNGHGPPPLPVAPVAVAAPARPAPKEEARPAASPAPPRQGIGREELTARLLQIVCQRTGYPPEMLGLDLDLEADLGIDSIKRVEILGSLSGADGEGGLAVEMEKLTGIKTLRGIIDCLW
jgi:hypothetical protein